MIQLPPISTLFPYTTLFRSNVLIRGRVVFNWANVDWTANVGDLSVWTADAGRSEEHRLNSSHPSISYAVFCLKKKIQKFEGAYDHLHAIMFMIACSGSHEIR